MKLNQLIAFQTVCDLNNNISQAAMALGLTQPAVTNSIRELERELGTPLFVHGPNYLMLTQAGEVCLSHTSEVLKSVADLKKAMEDFTPPVNELRIGFSSSSPALVPSIIEDLNRLYPDITPIIYERSVNELSEMLHCGLLDVCLMPEFQSAEMKKMVTYPLFKMPFTFITSIHDPLASRDCIDIHELAGYKFAFLRTGNQRTGSVTNRLKRAGIPLDNVVWVDSAFTLKRLIAEKGYSTLHFRYIMWYEPEITAIPLKDEPLVTFSLYINPTTATSAHVLQYIEYMCSYVKNFEHPLV